MNSKNRISILVIAAVALAGGLSCIKKPADEDAEIIASANEVTGKIASAWGNADPLTMQPNDFIYYETEQKLETNDPKVVLQEGVTISKKEDNVAENRYDYTYLYQFTPLVNGQGQLSTKEDHRSVDKPTAAEPAAVESENISMMISSVTDLSSRPQNLDLKYFSPIALTPSNANAVKILADDYQMSLGFEKLLNLAYACHPSDTLAQYCKEVLGADKCEIRCANLQQTNSVVAPPTSMANQTNCAGIPNCQLHLKRVEFDWSIIITKAEQTQKQKIHYAITTADELPFLSRVYENCVRGLVTANDGVTKALVNQCWKLKNYIPGH